MHPVIHFGKQTVLYIICLPTKIAEHLCSLARTTRRNDELVFLVLKQAKNTEMKIAIYSVNNIFPEISISCNTEVYQSSFF